jgi:poly-beta-1,6-N-acetyl-D-glucosamine synthase
MALPLIIILILIYCYFLLVFLFSLELKRDPDSCAMLPEQSRMISMIIPFRNEENNLSGLVEDLVAQSYPVHLWEVIFVDDHSEDHSAFFLASLISAIPGFSYHKLPPGKRGKKAALKEGIRQAKHDWIMQVDADCRIGSKFIASHVSFLEKHPSDLVAGLVNTRQGERRFLESFERLDILSLAGSGAGSFGLGRPMMCSGANLSYSRELYYATRSFDPEQETASGDDMFLMIGARKLGRILSYNTCMESIVLTEPARDLKTLVVQRMRWGSKTGSYGMPDIQLLALLVALVNSSILLMPVWILLFPGTWPWLTGACLAKTIADFFLLFRITGITASRAELKLFIPVALLYYPIFLVTMLGALAGVKKWKQST